MESECPEQTSQPDSLILDIHETEMIRLDAICRLCANQSEKVIGIYSEEGVSNDLAIKMNLYLPIKVAENDSLPLQCCWNCASTVLAWHELVVASVEADRRLRELQIVSVNQLPNTEEDDTKISSSPAHEVETAAASLTVFYQPTSPTRVRPQTVKLQKRKRLSEAEMNMLKTEVVDHESLEDVDFGNSFLSDCDNDEEEESKIKFDIEEVKYEPVEIKTKTVEGKKSVKKKNVKKELVEDSFQLPESANPEISVQDDNEDTKILSEWSDKETKLEIYNFACQYCSCMYVNEDDIINHVKERHPDKVDLLQKDPLLLQSLDKKEKRKHSKIDQDAVNEAKVVVEGRVYYNCKICGKSLYSPYTYIWHMRIHTGERPYVCDLCGKQFRVSQGLVRHLRETHEGIKNFPCDICGRMFATRRNVEEHRRIHTNERPYICDLCGKSFKQKASLFVHNRSHTDYFPYRCTYCNQGFRTRPPLLIHLTRHTGEKPYPCEVCGRCFRIKYELKRHRLIHSDDKPFSCAECGLSFRQKRSEENTEDVNSEVKLEDDNLLNDNYQSDDDQNTTVIEYYECSLCSVKFATEDLLVTHNKRKHVGKRRKRTDIIYDLFCDICRKGYTRRFDMEKHRKLKHPNAPALADLSFKEEAVGSLVDEDSSKCEDVSNTTVFQCRMCAASFDRKSELHSHEKKVHAVFKFRRKRGDIVAQYFCDICDKGFTRNHDMKKHRRKQHPEAPIPQAFSFRSEKRKYMNGAEIIGPDNKIFYKCNSCGKVFRQAYNLMRHQTIHTGIRAYFCHICGKNYPSSNGLKRHITEHHYGVKKYVCGICGKRFAASATRNEHLNIHTGTRPFVCDICGKCFKQKASLHTHKLFHTNNFRFSCNVCGKKFRRGTELKVHTWLHTGHKPHKCPLCPSSFRLNQDLKKHLRVHDKLSECACDECGSVFSQEKYLNNHKRWTHKTNKSAADTQADVKSEVM